MKSLPLAVPHMSEAEAEEVTSDDVVNRVLNSIEVP